MAIPPTAVPVTWSDLFAFMDLGADGVHDLEQTLRQEYNLAAVTVTTSGRAALRMALSESHKRNGGTNVIFPAYTCPVVYEAIISAGLTPVPVDISMATLNMEEDALTAALRHDFPSRLTDITAVLAIHLFGCPVDVSSIATLLKKEGVAPNVQIIEDCAQAIGAPGVGQMGNYVVFSFGPGKVITGGIGGALGVGSADITGISYPKKPGWGASASAFANVLAMKAGQGQTAYGLLMGSVTRRAGQDDRRRIDGIGARSAKQITFDEMPASASRTALAQFERLGEVIAKRKSNGRYLMALLREAKGITFPEQEEDSRSIFTRLVAYAPSQTIRDSIVATCRAEGFHAEAPYNELGLLVESYNLGPVTKAATERTFTLPVHHRVSESGLDAMAQLVLGCLRLGPAP